MVAVINGVSPKDKIDSAATDGLSGVVDSVAYRLHEIERHIHSPEHWLQKLDTPAGNKVATEDPRAAVSQIWVIDSGNLVYGAWVQILDTSDTPIAAGMAFYDLHEILVTTAERTSLYTMQLTWGGSDPDVQILLATNHTTITYIASSNNQDSGPTEIHGSRIAAGSRAWIRCHTEANTGTLNFAFALHEYPG